MKDWIMELCPEIAEWQADLIAEQAQKEVAAEREACAKTAEDFLTRGRSPLGRPVGEAIRARGLK